MPSSRPSGVQRWMGGRSTPCSAARTTGCAATQARSSAPSVTVPGVAQALPRHTHQKISQARCSAAIRSLRSQHTYDAVYRFSQPLIPAVNPKPSAAQVASAAPVCCQPPLAAASAATAGGPANWPKAYHCCTQPMVVPSIASPGAARTASENSEVGISPPTAENTSTAA